MRKIIIKIIIYGFLVTNLAFTIILPSLAQEMDWMVVTPPNVSSDWNLEHVHFTDSNEGWAVGWDVSNGKGVLLQYSSNVWVSVTPPTVSSVWGLWGVHFTSSNEGWAVGWDVSNGKGVLLNYSQGSWSSITPPDNSSNWILTGVHFTSSDDGWAVGRDIANRKGVILHYSNGSWTSVNVPNISSNWRLWDVYSAVYAVYAVGRDETNSKGILLELGEGGQQLTLPDVSPNWHLYGIGVFILPPITPPPCGYEYAHAVGRDESNKQGIILTNCRDIWSSNTLPYISDDWWLNGIYVNPWGIRYIMAVGYDSENRRGVLLRYGEGETVSPLPTLSGFTSGFIGISYEYITESSTSSLGHSIEYRFNWGDGTYSNWSSSTKASKTWSTEGTYSVKAQARCATHTSVVSEWSPGLSINISASEVVSSPSILSGPTTGAISIIYTYSTGGSTSNYGHDVQYLYDWGDGTNSGWLPVGTTSSSKVWTSSGNFLVKAQARCSTDTSIVSEWSSGLSVTIVGMSITSPNGGENWKSGTTQTISWNYTGTPGQYVKIELLNTTTPVIVDQFG